MSYGKQNWTGGDFTPEQLRAIQQEWRRHGPRIVELWARSESVNRVTPAPTPLADTLNNGARSAPPNGETKMFANDTTETILTKIIAAAMLAAFVASLVA